MNELLELMKSIVLEKWSENEVYSCGVSMEYAKDEECVKFLVTKNRDE